MAVGVTSDATMRDARLDLDFKDACNCSCCGPRKVPPSQLVYVNSRGKVEIWDPKKAPDAREAQTRSLHHLLNFIEEKADAKRAKYVKRTVLIEQSIDLETRRSPPLTFRTISSINDIVARALEMREVPDEEEETGAVPSSTFPVTPIEMKDKISAAKTHAEMDISVLTLESDKEKD